MQDLSSFKSKSPKTAKKTTTTGNLSADSTNHLSSESDSHDVYSYNPDHKFSKGWKFDYDTLLRQTGDVEPQTCTVIDVCPNEKRIVKCADGTICALHVDDIEVCKPVPMFRHTLRVGDEIEYEHDDLITRTSNDGPIIMDGRVMEISDSYMKDSTRPHVRTSRAGCIANGSFRVMRSKNTDAPTTGKWTSFSKVNLEYGEIDLLETEEERDIRLLQRAKDGIQKEGFGKLGVLAFSAAEINKYMQREVKDAKKDAIDQDDHSTTDNKQDAKGKDDNSATDKSDESKQIQGIVTRSKTKKWNVQLDYYGNRTKKKSKK